ncbi:ABC transporter permease [Occallatibacter riparius]|uniref:ABC transporter permease n=1 Tax=Occallatibacter riparius TaxID=1002689 RepID=A0A9J7BJZ6_9BACT|nr:FtsX-like permease family protein [Occallatibacter riparius]UWZ82777.1 ABC transporter permease [Occallatibacter riparius]
MASPAIPTAPKRALTWRRATAIALRDLKSAPGKFGFVVLSVAIGVAALVGVRGFAESFRRTLGFEARSLMAGDLSARIFGLPTPAENTRIQAVEKGLPGTRSTWVTETLSMASVAPDPVPLLVTLKAVDPTAYPFYGEAKLQPSMTLQQALAGDSAVVADEFLVRLNAHVGQSLRLGDKTYRIAAVLQQEPDRISAGAGMGPRVMISRASLDASGLIAPGSRASARLLLKLPDPLPKGVTPLSVRHDLEAAMPDAQVMDYREGNPAITDGLDRATAILSLICLVAMVLGAIGVAMAMHAHLEQRMDMLAILKAIGAGSADLLRIFLIQTLGLGLAGGLLGVAAGIGVMKLLPAVFGKLLPVHTVLEVPWHSIAAGLGTGLLTTLLFCLPPLLDVRAVRPVLVLRRLVEQGPEGIGGWVAKLRARWLQLAIALVVLAALVGIAWALSDSATVGFWFAAGLTGALAVLLVLAFLLLRFLRWILNRVRLHLPSSLRHGLANLYRPGNQSAAVLASLGTGVMLILSVYLMQSSLLREIKETASPKLPNMFLIDITSDEAPGLRDFLAHQHGVTEPVDLMPIVRGEFVSIHGKPLDQFKGQHVPLRSLQNSELTWSDKLPEGLKVLKGAWFTGPDVQQIAVADWIADRLHLAIGSSMELDTAANGRHKLTVSTIYKGDGQHTSSRESFVLPSGALKGEVATWYGGVHAQAAQIPAIERALFQAYPTVTVINIADILTRIETVVDQITFVIHFLAGFSIFAGLTILASSIASTRFRRMREAVVLKTLGATRMRIVRTFSVEFSVLGLLAGMVGVVFANLLTRVLLHRMQVGYHINWPGAAVALIGTAILATGTGWIASYRILGLRPLEVLREE